MNRKIRFDIPMALAFCLPIFILLVIFIAKRIYPFGDRSFLRIDLYHQYAPFMAEFWQKLHERDTWYYSFDVGMGTNFFTIYAYYLASPFNLLLLFCPRQYVIEFLSYLMIFKSGLMSLSFTYYLKKHFRLQGKRVYPAIFFGMAYALSAYMAAYNWNIMWLDCIIVFPLLLLSLERLIAENKGVAYSIWLGLCIFSNYYIGIMICIFLILYFVLRLLLCRRWDILSILKAGLRFAIHSLIGGMLAGVLWIPSIYALFTTASSESGFPKTFKEYFTIIEVLARHIPGVATDLGLNYNHFPNIYCGIAVILLMILYLLNKKIGFREKILYISLLVFLIAGFSINVLNYIWHGMHYPNSLPSRQSFIYIFLVLYMSFAACKNISYNSKRDIYISFGISIGFILAVQNIMKENEDFHFSVFYIAICAICIYSAMIYAYKMRKLRMQYLFVILAYLLSMELGANMFATSITTVSREEYTKDYLDIRNLYHLTEDTGFYRFDRIKRRSNDDGAWLHIPTESIFSSTAYADMTNYFKKVGNEASTNAYTIKGQTPLFDMLFSVRYRLYPQDFENRYIKKVASSNEMYLYENKYTLPLGYRMDTDIYEAIENLGNKKIEYQNEIADIFGANPVLVNVNSNEGEYFYADLMNISEDGEYFLVPQVTDLSSITITIDDEKKTYNNLSRDYIIDLDFIKKDSVLSVEDEEGKSIQYALYKFDYQALEKIYDTLHKDTLEIETIQDGYLKGSIESTKAGILFLSIPYDASWQVKVNGADVQAIKAFDAMMAIPIEEGKTDLELRFVPRGLYIGVSISIIGLLLLCLCIWESEILAYCRDMKEKFVMKEMKKSNKDDMIEEIEENE